MAAFYKDDYENYYKYNTDSLMLENLWQSSAIILDEMQAEYSIFRKLPTWKSVVVLSAGVRARFLPVSIFV